MQNLNGSRDFYFNLLFLRRRYVFWGVICVILVFSFSWLRWRKFAVHGNPRLSEQRVGIVCLQSCVRLKSVVQERTWDVTNPSLGYYSGPLSYCSEVMNS